MTQVWAAYFAVDGVYVVIEDACGIADADTNCTGDVIVKTAVRVSTAKQRKKRPSLFLIEFLPKPLETFPLNLH